jgi:hypothetical protein
MARGTQARASATIKEVSSIKGVLLIFLIPLAFTWLTFLLRHASKRYTDTRATAARLGAGEPELFLTQEPFACLSATSP